MPDSRSKELRASAKHSRYIVASLVHAAEVMSAFRSGGEVLRLRDVVERTSLTKGTCFRILYTLHVCNFVEKLGTNQYRLVRDVRPARKFRVGYASQGQDSSLSREVDASLSRAAETANVELVVVDNRYDARVAVRNADHLIREEVELVIEFQTDEAVAPVIARKLLDAGIPVIAVDIPHPGATYFGANNYEAGLIAGRHLAKFAAQNWKGEVDEVLTLEIRRAGSVPQTRIHGVLSGISGVLGAHAGRTVQLDGDGQFGVSLEVVRQHLRRSQAKRVLVGAANDPSALGALRAFQEAGRMEHCAIVGQNAEPQGRAELRKANTRMIGSVAYFPEKYGPRIVRLALDILEHKPTPPAVFMKHQLVTAENVNHFYPNDSLIERLQAQA
jgi:ribose transport system substrate-binding protein